MFAFVWVCKSRLHKLYCACVSLLCIQVCIWLLVQLQAYLRLSSHQDVPTGPSLGSVPGLSTACVLAECCQIIPHTWKVAWRWNYSPFTLNPCLPHPINLKAAPLFWLKRLETTPPRNNMMYKFEDKTHLKTREILLKWPGVMNFPFWGAVNYA